MSRSVVLVVGPGRSGTSSMAGTLAHSGFHVPGALPAHESNPRGFYEPRWALRFHKRLLEESGVRSLDCDPAALEPARKVQTEQARVKLREWLRRELSGHDRLVLKDPRMVWFRDLYVEACRDLDLEPSFVVMLRHPSEVVASRSAYYDADAVLGVAGWVNVALVTEQLTADFPRAFVHYPDLIGDWRAQAERLERFTDIRFDPRPEERPHPVDDFIDPSLRRMPAGWGEVAVPGDLRDLAERTFDAMSGLIDAPTDPTARGRLDELRAEYASFYEMARLITRSRHRRREQQVRERTRERTVERTLRRIEHERAAGHAGLLSRLRARLPARWR